MEFFLHASCRALYHNGNMERQNASNHCVYKHLVPDGRYYIGLTSNLSSRWAHSGLHYKNTKLFYPCIKKYGWDNIEHIVLHSNLSLAEAQDLERKYIKEAKDAGVSLNQNNGGTPGSITRRSKTCNPKEDSIWHFVPIRVYKNGEFVGDFESLHQASRDLGIPRRSLQRILKDGTQMRNGYSVKKM